MFFAKLNIIHITKLQANLRILKKGHTEYIVGIHCVDGSSVENLDDLFLHKIPGQFIRKRQQLCSNQLHHQTIHEFVSFSFVRIQWAIHFAIKLICKKFNLIKIDLEEKRNPSTDAANDGHNCLNKFTENLNIN